MDLADVKHRLCQTSLLDPGGCDICVPVKRDLLIPDGDELDVLNVSRQSIKVLKVVLGRLDRELKDPGYKSSWAKDAAAISNSLSRAVDAMRKYEGDISALAEAMSEDERERVLVHWARHLSKEKKAKIITILQDSLQERILVG